MRYEQERKSADETRNCGSWRKNLWKREQEMIQNSMWESRSNREGPYIK